MQPSAAAAAPTASSMSEKLSLTGTLSFEGGFHPVLKAGDKEYELLVPRHLTWNLDVREGEQVSVEGYAVQGTPCRAPQVEGEIELLVTKAADPACVERARAGDAASRAERSAPSFG